MVSKYPNDAEVLYLAADLAWKTGDQSSARSLLARSLTRDAKLAKAHQLEGTLLAHSGDLVAARQQLEQAIALGDAEQDVFYQLARVEKRLGDADAAQRTSEAYQNSKAVDAARTKTAERIFLGNRALHDGDAATAATLLRQALELSPNEALTHYQLSRALDQMHDLAGERSELQQALKLNPNFAEALNQMGYLLLHAGDSDAAATYFLTATRISPTYVVAWNNLAATYAREAHWRQASEAADQALRIDPSNPMTQKIKASIARSQATPSD